MKLRAFFPVKSVFDSDHWNWLNRPVRNYWRHHTNKYYVRDTLLRSLIPAILLPTACYGLSVPRGNSNKGLLYPSQSIAPSVVLRNKCVVHRLTLMAVAFPLQYLIAIVASFIGYTSKLEAVSNTDVDNLAKPPPHVAPSAPHLTTFNLRNSTRYNTDHN